MFGTNLAAWYAPESKKWQDSGRTTAAVADADPVGAWDDISGRARHIIQATGSQRPTLRLGIKNGYPAVRADGVDDFLGIASLSLAQPAWEFVAFKMVSLGAGNQTVIDGATQNESRLYVIASTSMNASAGGTITDTFTVTTNTVYIAACRFNGASSSLQINNRAQVTGNAGSATATGLRVGGDGTQFANVDILERFRVQADISQTVANQARLYLNSRYSGF
jgi:hypothetical protein